MKTEYAIKSGSRFGSWMPDPAFLREYCRRNGNTLHRRKTETPEEAAVRRMAALGKWWADKNSPERLHYEKDDPASFADRLLPPPPATETQVDWDTLEPIKEVPVITLYSGAFIAGMTEKEYTENNSMIVLSRLTGKLAAIGHTRESALRNLAELQSIKK